MQIKNQVNEQLVGVLTGETTDKLTIICHGLADTADNPLFVKLSEELQPSFRFDFSGNGESQGDFKDSTYHKQVADLQAVIKHFQAQGVKRFCLVGHSMGGGVCQFVAQQPEINALITLGGVSQPETFKDKFPDMMAEIEEKGQAFLWPEKHGEQFPITQAYVESAESLDIQGAALSVHCPVLAVQGSNDSQIRAEQTKDWLNALPDDTTSMFVELHGADHFFNRFKPEAEKTFTALLSIVKPWWDAHF